MRSICYGADTLKSGRYHWRTGCHILLFVSEMYTEFHSCQHVSYNRTTHPTNRKRILNSKCTACHQSRKFPGRCNIIISFNSNKYFNNIIFCHVGRDSSVGIATCYGLDILGIESRWGRDFPHPSRLALGPTQPPIWWVLGLSGGVKCPGRGFDHPPLSSVEVKERVELYFYSPSGPSWPVIGWLVSLHSSIFLIITDCSENDTIDLAQDGASWQAPLNVAMNVWVP
jgi:hypothetical protein